MKHSPVLIAIFLVIVSIWFSGLNLFLHTMRRDKAYIAYIQSTRTIHNIAGISDEDAYLPTNLASIQTIAQTTVQASFNPDPTPSTEPLQQEPTPSPTPKPYAPTPKPPNNPSPTPEISDKPSFTPTPILTIVTTSPTSPPNTPTPNPSPTKTPEPTNDLLDALNQYRQKYGFSSLASHSELCDEASTRAVEASSDFNHSKFDQRAQSGDYDYLDYKSIGENIWQGSPMSNKIIIESWHESTSHRNAMQGDWTHGCGATHQSTAAFLFLKQ